MIYKAVILSPLLIFLVGEDPADYMDHGPSGFLYVHTLMIYPVLCVFVMPFKILRREYSVWAKVFGIIGCVLGAALCFAIILELSFDTTGF